MGIPVLILGESGSGKSASLRNFDEKEIGIFNVAAKPLPFRKKLPKVDNANYKRIESALAEPKLKTYVIDDSQYLLAFDFFDRAKEIGYQKFTDMALSFRNLIQFVITKTPPDVIVYFLHHVERREDGVLKAKTIGKMLDEKLTVEGLFSIVLMAQTDGKEHWFLTQNDGLSTVKSPMEMFSTEKIDNDLKLVDTVIRDYYELNTTNKKEKKNND